MRKFSTTRLNEGFSDQIKLQVWNKARIVPGYNPAQFRKDSCGALMEWSKYGVTVEGGYGWEIDHITPISRGGSDNLDNLQALQWQNNRKKGDDLQWSCAVTMR